MSERAKPWVGYMSTPLSVGAIIERNPTDYFCVPVVVTPLLPDDPRVGETWIDDNGETCVILTAPYQARDHVGVVVAYGRGGWSAIRVNIANLHRPPVRKLAERLEEIP